MDNDPFQVLRAYDARVTWENARKRGSDPAVVARSLRDIPEVSPLDALKANKQAVELLVAGRWHIMQHAREQGVSWSEIGEVLGIPGREAQGLYVEAIERAEKLIPDVLDAPRARAVIDTPGSPEL